LVINYLVAQNVKQSDNQGKEKELIKVDTSTNNQAIIRVRMYLIYRLVVVVVVTAVWVKELVANEDV